MNRRSLLVGGASLLATGLAAPAIFTPPALAGGDVCVCNGWEECHGVLITQCCELVCAEFPSEAAFRAAVKKEGGWHELAPGHYIMWWNGEWHHSDHNETHTGHRMTRDTIACDYNFLPKWTKVRLPGVDMIFTVKDTGEAFRGTRQVNYLVGKGKRACAAVRPIHNATILIQRA